MPASKYHWTTLGFPTMDEDHLRLAEKLQALADAALAGRPTITLRQDANELLRMTELHFGSEERLMEATAYPHLDHHRTQHVALKIELRQLCDDLVRHDDQSLIARTLNFLNYWLEHHVDISDRHLAEWHLAQATDSVS